MRRSFLLQILMFAVLLSPTIGFAQTVQPQESSGLSLYEVVAEAGLHPERPVGDVQKALTIDGHAYWIRSTPVFSSGVKRVEILKKGCGRVEFQFKLTKTAQVAFFKYSSNNLQKDVAFVLDGKIISRTIRIAMPLDISYAVLPDMGVMEGMLLMMDIQKVGIPTTVQR